MAAGRRFHVRRASQGASAPMTIRLPNVASRIAGIRSTPVATGGSRWRISPSSSVIAMKVGHIHAPAQSPADTGRPEALVSIHWGGE